jgi:hypothetical protein
MNYLKYLFISTLFLTTKLVKGNSLDSLASPNQKHDVFEVTSLSADESQLVKLTITITPEGVAHVSKSFMVKSSTDVVQQHVVGRNLDNISTTKTNTDERTGFLWRVIVCGRESLHPTIGRLR